MRRIALCCAVLFAVGCKCGGAPPGPLGDVLTSYCKYIDRCPDQLAFPIAYRNQAECVDILNFSTTCRLTRVEGPGGEDFPAIEKVNPNIDAAAAMACQAFLETASCDALNTDCDEDTDAGCNPCSRLFSSSGGGGTGGGPTKALLDQPCDQTDDCAAGFYCINPKSTADGGQTCRVCKPLRAAGGDCQNPPYVPCGPGLFCDGTTGACVGLLPAGSACTYAGQCASEFCNSRTRQCDAAGRLGDACTAAGDCRLGYCDPTQKCSERKQNGAACTVAGDCLGGVCDPGTSRCGKPDGAMCNSSGECQGYCDTTARQCRTAAANGTSCMRDEQCQSRMCHSNLRTCVTRCSDGCAAAEFCDSYGACRPKLAAGSQCDDDDECDTGFCNDDERCAMRPAIGGACTSSSDCFPKGYCSGGTCTAYAKPDQACTGLDSCAPPFICSNGKCTLISLSCEPAKSGSQCTWLQVCDETAFCDVLDNFTCKPKKTAGASCLRSTECPTGQYCERRVCTSYALAGAECDNDKLCAAGLFCDESVSPSVCSGPKAPGASCQQDSDCASGSCEFTGGSGRTCQAACLPVPVGEQPACRPTKCSELGFNCGTIDAGCEVVANCGTCTQAYQTCGGGGQPQVCGCTPTRTCLPRQCNVTIDDGCGRMLQCNDACDGGATCGGGSVGVCSCPATHSAGPSHAVMAASVMIPGTSGGFLPWDQLDKLGTADDAGARVVINSPNSTTSSQYLLASGFGFNLPPTASVNGVTVYVRRRATGRIDDSSVALYSGGTRLGVGAPGGGRWSTDWTTEQFGSVTHLFNYPLTPAIVNSPDFGFALSVSGTGTSEALVDDVQMHISYAYRCDCSYACRSDSECGNDGCGGFCGSQGGGCGVDGGTCGNTYCRPVVFADPVTGLMWANAAFDVANCDTLVYGGYSDWRVPTIDELRTRVLGCPATAPGGRCPASTTCTTPGTCLDAGCEGCDYRTGPAPNGCYLDKHLDWNSCTGAGPLFSSTLAGGTPYTIDFATGQIGVGGGMVRYRCVRP